MATSLTHSTPQRSAGRARSSRDARFQDIAGLRATLPKYWWNEVSRVRALIERDVETGGLAAVHFEYVAEALGQGDGELTREHAAALWAASRQLSAIAQARQSAAA